MSIKKKLAMGIATGALAVSMIGGELMHISMM